LRTYLIKSNIEKKHGYDEGVFKECNHLFKWISKDTYHEAWGIGTNQTKYTLGTDSVNNSFIESDSRYAIDFPNDLNCQSISVGTRFLFNGGAWKVTQIDYISSGNNIRSLLLGQDSISETDDTKNEIADAFANQYSITLNSVTQTLNVGVTYQISASVSNKGKLVSSPNILWSSSDNTIATVNNGLVTAIGVGSAIITASIGSVTATLSLTINANTSTNPVISYGYSFSQTTTIKEYVTSILNCTKTINAVSSPLSISYNFDSLGQSLISSGKITVTTKSSSSIAIKNVSVSTNTLIHLTVTDSSDNSVILDNINITLVGM
jgi:uncharacterized protein YjdB